MFSCEYCEISKNNLFIEHLRWLLLHLMLFCIYYTYVYFYFTHILHFLLWRHVTEERILMDFFKLSFRRKSKHIKLALNFVQKEYFN